MSHPLKSMMKFDPVKKLSSAQVKRWSDAKLKIARKRISDRIDFGPEYGETIARANLELVQTELRSRGALSGLDWKSGDFWKGAAIGAVATFVLKGLRG